MPGWVSDLYWTYQDLIYGLGTNAILGLSIYAVLQMGMLSLGQAAFMGIGAYAGAILTLKLGLPFPLVLLASAALPAAAAFLIGGPTLKLAGVHLAIATIGLGEILKVVYVNSPFLGGALGLSGIPDKSDFPLIYGLLALLLAGFWLAGRSKIGRAMEAIREDEEAASLIGIDVRSYKLSGLVLSAALAGLAGALNAHYSSFIGPGEYGFESAVSILSFAILGGIGTPFGPVLGAFLLTALPEILRPLHEVRLIFNGLIIVAVVLFLPRGLIGLRLKRSRGA